MASNLIVKFTCGTDIRRYTASLDQITWASLSKRAADSFSTGGAPLKLSYVDDEGDKVTFSSDDELADAVGLALSSTPPVLRVGVAIGDAPAPDPAAADADAPMPEATANPPHNPSAAGADEVSAFLAQLASQLPGMLHTLPESVRRILPHAELDVAATIAANTVNSAASHVAAAAAEAGAAAGAAVETAREEAAKAHAAAQTAADAAAQAAHTAAASFGDAFGAAAPPARPSGSYSFSFSQPGGAPPPQVHLGVTCDKSGMSPIVGKRYHLPGHDYDLCEAEFLKLSPKEKAHFALMPPPAAPRAQGGSAGPGANAQGPPPSGPAAGVHPGVSCDRSGMLPIVGTRFKMRGHNYDLCQAEFDKLSADDQALYEAIPPPGRSAHRNFAFHGGFPHHGFGGGWGGGGGCGGGGAWAWGGGGGGGAWRTHRGSSSASAASGSAPAPAPASCGGGKLAARFVRDVTIFDGTQVAPLTSFTKIWRIKNIGTAPWPPGTRVLFVGGDQMSSELSVPISRTDAVMPDEEVDIGVDLKAPQELGRYLGYWRLTGPWGRKKFGQRVWCHIQVVDPAEPPDDAAVESVALEATRKTDETRSRHDEDDEDDASLAGAADVAMTDDKTGDDKTGDDKTGDEAGDEQAAESADGAPLLMGTPVDPPSESDAWPAGTDSDEGGRKGSESGESDDGVVVTAGMLLEAMAPAASEPPAAADFTTLPADAVAEAVASDAVAQAGASKGPEAIAEAIAQGEWQSLLDDLNEMGFTDRELNARLVVQFSGNMKRTVKALVEDN